ncbi:amino acid ABC transporter permease [Hoeflea alexandrii]|uniref:amino acid ABC transporter permease n=1 Tax=Hoeflea alexandrii TaxID=288436 RepID=UPI0022AEDC18|nr:amino acid ABC transporter permease [Hoeflea alexandrii]MCZ4291635.1 amino acid ABC transporter permease [Hoeflea alexandrii]
MSVDTLSPLPGRKQSLLSRLFSRPLDVVISVTVLLFAASVLWQLSKWAIIDAVWTSPDATSEVCRGVSGACWAVIDVRWRLIVFGLFPYEEQWRSSLACIVMVIVAILSCVPMFWTAIRLSALWIVGFSIFYALMAGGVLGLTPIAPDKWGGLTLTVFIYAAGMLIGMPMAIALALMRRATLPVIARTTGIIIDSVRSLPLITILFTAALVLPFVLPEWLLGDKIWRVILGFALFFAAYEAENIRSGIQALPSGQEEAARALGLTYWQRTSRIILPQALRNALPPTINQFVISFKETSLIVIIGFFDVMASGKAAYGSGEWSFAWVEVYVFVALIYFIFVFSLSRYGAYLERRLRVGQH